MNVNNLMVWLSGNPYLNLLFLALAIASIVVSLLLYFRGKKSKKPTYITKSFAIIDDRISAIDGLEIQYKKREVQRLTLSKLSFWNGGHETIHGSDIAPADKLRIISNGDGQLISARHIWEKRSANNIKTAIEDNEAYMFFDFLDYSDGAIFELYHTGSADIPLQVAGTIKGAHRINYGESKELLVDRVTSPLFWWVDKIPNNPALLFMLFMASLPIFLPFLLVLFPIDILSLYFHRIPKQYDLSGSKTPNRTSQKA